MLLASAVGLALGLSELAIDPDWRGERVPVEEAARETEGEPLELEVTDSAAVLLAMGVSLSAPVIVLVPLGVSPEETLDQPLGEALMHVVIDTVPLCTEDADSEGELVVLSDAHPEEVTVKEVEGVIDADAEEEIETVLQADHVPTCEVAMGVPVKLATSDVEGDWLALEDCDAVGHCDWDPEDGPLSLALGEAV